MPPKRRTEGAKVLVPQAVRNRTKASVESQIGYAPLDDSEKNNAYEKNKVRGALFHDLFLGNFDGQEELSMLGREFFNSLTSNSGSRVPVLNISYEDLSLFLEFIRREKKTTGQTDWTMRMPGLKPNEFGTDPQIDPRAPLVLWTPDYSTLLPRAQQITLLGKARAKEAAATSTNKSMFEKLKNVFDNRFRDDNDGFWGEIEDPNATNEDAIEALLPFAAASINNTIQAHKSDLLRNGQDLQTEYEKNPKQPLQYKTHGALGQGKTFSPGVIKLGRHTCRY